MSILVIHGLHRSIDGRRDAPVRLPDHLAEKARSAGSGVEFSACASAAGLVRCLRRARDPRIDIVLLAPGDLDPLDCARHAPQLRDALDRLRAPYIEVHDDAGQELECRVRPAHPALAIVVMTRDLAKSYAVSMDIALRCIARAILPRQSGTSPRAGVAAA